MVTMCIHSAVALYRFPPPVQFSQCSRNHLAEGFDAGRDICLDNSPTMVSTGLIVSLLIKRYCLILFLMYFFIFVNITFGIILLLI